MERKKIEEDELLRKLKIFSELGAIADNPGSFHENKVREVFARALARILGRLEKL